MYCAVVSGPMKYHSAESMSLAHMEVENVESKLEVDAVGDVRGSIVTLSYALIVTGAVWMYALLCVRV